MTILQHLHQFEECNGELNDFEIVGEARNDFCLHIKESLLIQKFKSSLKRKKNSIVTLLKVISRSGRFVRIFVLSYSILMCSLLLSISCTLKHNYIMYAYYCDIYFKNVQKIVDTNKLNAVSTAKHFNKKKMHIFYIYNIYIYI